MQAQTNKKVRVYIAGPITHGNKMLNCLKAIQAANKVMDLGMHPFLPHLDFWWNEISPKNYEQWIEWDFSWLEVCDAVLRIPGKSNGADREVVFALEHNIPVFYSIKSLKETIKCHTSNQSIVS